MLVVAFSSEVVLLLLLLLLLLSMLLLLSRSTCSASVGNDLIRNTNNSTALSKISLWMMSSRPNAQRGHACSCVFIYYWVRDEPGVVERDAKGVRMQRGSPSD